MADISKITLPSGNTYNIKDSTAREAIAALEGGSYFLGTTTTELVDNDTTNPIIVDGASVTATNGNMVIYGKKEFVFNGTKWVEFGDLSALGELAYKDFVTINKGNGDIVLGEDTTFTNSSSTVSFANGTTDVVLGETTTFTSSTPTITVTPTTTNIKATASGTAVGSNGTAAAITGFGTHSTDTFVKSVTAETNNKLVTTSITPTNGTETVSKVTKTASKLVTTSIPNVTGNTSVSFKDYDFSMGTGNEAETLIIGKTDKTATNTTLGTAITAATGGVASNGSGSDIVTAVTVSDKTVAKVGSAVTVATGSVSTSGSGSAVVTGITIGDSATAITALGTPTTSNCLTGVKVTTQPTISLSTGATAGTGVISVATGITSATSTQPTITVGTNDKVTAVTNIGTGTAEAQTITVGTNDRVKVIKYDDLSVDSEKKVYRFDGLEISPGPLFYDGTNYKIKNSWNYSSYNSVYGKNENSSYFNFIQMGQLFEKSNFGTSDGNIENLLNPLNGWRLPTTTEFQSIIGQTRNGSTVNNVENVCYSAVSINGITYANASNPYGFLLFPDGETMIGATLSNINNTIENSITIDQLNSYLNQGCAFLPAGGRRNNDWSDGGTHCRYMSGNSSSDTNFSCMYFYHGYYQPSNLASKTNFYGLIRLVK